MDSIASFIIANSYAGTSTWFNGLAAVCRVNGEVTACPDIGVFLGIFSGVFFLVWLVVVVVVAAGAWKMFQKAGEPGWAAIIPFYNYYVMLRMVRRPGWWLVLYFIPIVNIVVAIINAHDLAKAFGKDIGYTFGLIIIPVVFIPILGFGSAQYVLGAPVAPVEPMTPPTPAPTV